MITCRLAIMTIYAALGTAGSALADGGDIAKAPWPGECLTCHAVADRGGAGPIIASANGRSMEAATGFRFCDGPLTVGELSIGKISARSPARAPTMAALLASDTPERGDRLAFLRALTAR